MTLAIAPIHKQIAVHAPPEHAFEIFTAGMGRWWNPQYSIATEEMATVVVEEEEGAGGSSAVSGAGSASGAGAAVGATARGRAGLADHGGVALRPRGAHRTGGAVRGRRLRHSCRAGTSGPWVTGRAGRGHPQLRSPGCDPIWQRQPNSANLPSRADRLGGGRVQADLALVGPDCPKATWT